MHNTD